MSRSIKKGPFVDHHLIKKVEAARAGDHGRWRSAASQGRAVVVYEEPRS